MGLVNKVRRLMLGRSLTQILLPTGVFFLAVYFMMFSSTVGKRSNFSRKVWQFFDSSGDDTTSEEYCNPTSITRRVVSKMNHSAVSCKPHVASKTACNLAKQLYYTDPKLKTCGYSRPVEICKHLESDQNEPSTFKCSLKDCRKYKRDNVLVWSTFSSTGRLEKSNFFKRESDLQNSIDKIVAKSRKDGFSFLIFECTDSKNYKRAAHDFIGQLFLIPPITAKKYKQKEKKININMVMIDSAARSHFYRSLPKTISTFSKINKYRHVKAEILDFELFQSLEGHTAENLHGLFTGKLFPKSFTGEEREKSAIGVGDFLKIFKSEGYKTIYQDDLCFDEFWGMRLDLGTPNSWGEFLKAKAKNYIESTGRLTSISFLHIFL